MPETSSGSTATSISPRIRSGARLVASTVNPGTASMRAAIRGATSSRCSTLSSTSRVRCWRSRSTTAEAASAPGAAGASTASAIAGNTSSAARSGANSTYATPSANRPCTAAATASASRVFPTPPIPVSVTNRLLPDQVRHPGHVLVASQQLGGRRRYRPPSRGRVAGRTRRSGPRGHGRDQRSPRVGVGTERIAQRTHGVWVGTGPGPTLERAIAWLLSPARSASSSWENPAASRMARRRSANEPSSVTGPLPRPRAASVRRLAQGRA